MLYTIQNDTQKGFMKPAYDAVALNNLHLQLKMHKRQIP